MSQTEYKIEVRKVVGDNKEEVISVRRVFLTDTYSKPPKAIEAAGEEAVKEFADDVEGAVNSAIDSTVEAVTSRFVERAVKK